MPTSSNRTSATPRCTSLQWSAAPRCAVRFSTRSAHRHARTQQWLDETPPARRRPRLPTIRHADRDEIVPGSRRGRTPGCALRAAGRSQDRADLYRGGDGREPRDATRYHQLRTSAGAGGHQSRAGARAARPRQLQLARQPITADATFHNIHCRRRLWLLRVVRRRS